MSSFTYTSKFFSLAPYLLMEYRYGTQPNPEYHPVSFGLNAVGFEKITNGYFNGAVQITNRNQDTQTTGNVRDRSSVQVSQNTFVRLDIDRLEEYLDYDDKLTDVSNLPVEFENNINVYYDTIRYHFLSGYNFGSKDGVIVQVQFPERNGKKATVSQITYEKGDLNATTPNPSPIYFNAGIYDHFVEVKIPSYASITYDYDTQSVNGLASQTIASKISSDGQGFVRNQPFNVSLFEIETTNDVNGFFYYQTALNTVATVTPYDEYADLAANITENTEFDYFEYYPSWQDNFIEDFIYAESSLGNIYYIIHDIEVREQVGLRRVTSQKIQLLQDKDYNSPYLYRPVIMNPKATSFSINYTMRLVNKFSNVSILRTATITSTEVDKYGPGVKRISLLHQPYPQKVYNKVVEPQVSKAYTLNVNPIERVITKYVPAFFERENVNVSEEDLTIDNLGGLTQSSTVDASIAFGQGKSKIVINPYDNYYKFRVFVKNDGKENTLLDLGSNSDFYLVFEGGDSKTVRISSLSDSTFQNPSKGELVFRVVESDSKKIAAFTGRDFHIVAKTNNGIETSIYHGYWILPSERDQKPVAVTPATPPPAPAPVIIAPVQATAAPAPAPVPTPVPTPPVDTAVPAPAPAPAVVETPTQTPSTPTVDIIPQQPKEYFDIKTDPVILNVEPAVITNPIVEEPVIVKKVPIRADIDTLANLIKMDENAGKLVPEICDYYTVPGNPGNLLYEGINVRFFLNAVRLVHPDIFGRRSDEFAMYANYLGEIYDPYENQKYPSGGGGGAGGGYIGGGGVGYNIYDKIQDRSETMGQTFFL